ncbi:hypothetical protein [Clostridium sp. DJ247]|nr:hypothetical protein [Clostridium sp. DJ247]
MYSIGIDSESTTKGILYNGGYIKEKYYKDLSKTKRKHFKYI